MVAIEYLGGLPHRERVVPVEVTVQGQALRFKHGRLLGGWSQQVPLAGASVRKPGSANRSSVNFALAGWAVEICARGIRSQNG